MKLILTSIHDQVIQRLRRVRQIIVSISRRKLPKSWNLGLACTIRWSYKHTSRLGVNIIKFCSKHILFRHPLLTCIHYIHWNLDWNRRKIAPYLFPLVYISMNSVTSAHRICFICPVNVSNFIINISKKWAMMYCCCCCYVFYIPY